LDGRGSVKLGADDFFLRTGNVVALRFDPIIVDDRMARSVVDRVVTSRAGGILGIPTPVGRSEGPSAIERFRAKNKTEVCTIR